MTILLGDEISVFPSEEFELRVIPDGKSVFLQMLEGNSRYLDLLRRLDDVFSVYPPEFFSRFAKRHYFIGLRFLLTDQILMDGKRFDGVQSVHTGFLDVYLAKDDAKERAIHHEIWHAIRCGECSGWFGSKVWHSTDQYRRVIWRCNAKYGGKAAGCKTPHVTEEEVKAAFVRVVNKLIGNRAMLLADLREIQETYSGTDELSQRLHELDDRLNAEAEMVQELIAQNARVAQNQDDYNAAYDAAVSCYEATKAEREKVAADIRQRGIRRREFERFITELEKLPKAVSEFDEALWGSLVEYVTVGKDKTMVFTLPGGTEIKACSVMI